MESAVMREQRMVRNDEKAEELPTSELQTSKVIKKDVNAVSKSPSKRCATPIISNRAQSKAQGTANRRHDELVQALSNWDQIYEELGNKVHKIGPDACHLEWTKVLGKRAKKARDDDPFERLDSTG